MNPLKKTLSLLVVGCLALCLAACTTTPSGEGESTEDPAKQEEQEQAYQQAIEDAIAEGRAQAAQEAADAIERATKDWKVVTFEKGKIEYNGIGDLVVTLVEHPSSGYHWSQSISGTGLAYQGEKTLAPEQVAIAEPDPDMATVLDGTAGEKIYTYAGADPGNATITLLCSTTEGKENETAVKFTIDVVTGENGVVESVSAKQETVQGPRKVSVPNLTGLTAQQTEDALISLGLVPRAADPQPNTTVNPGQCWQQNYEPGSVVKEGTEVWYRIALGEEVARVPSVAGLDQYAAAQTLQNAGFGVDVIFTYNDSVPYNVVVGSNPYENVKCVKGTTVLINVSQGPTPPVGAKVYVPNVITLTLQQAQAVLQSAGLNCSYVGSGDGIVTSQDIMGGTQVNAGTTVTVTITPEN